MARISSDVLADIIGNFYEAAYDESRWQGAVESLRQIWDGATVCIALQNIKTYGGIAIHTGVDESYHRSYFEEYARYNLIENALIPAPAGTIFTNWNPVSRDTWLNSRFWNEWMAPQDLHHLLGAKIQLFGDVLGTLQIQRGRQRSDFDATDIAILRQLVPAITRAAYLGHRIGALKLETQIATMAVGALQIAKLVVAADSNILDLNDAAEACLARRGCGLSRRNNRLFASDIATSTALQRLIVDACRLHDGQSPGRGGDLLVHPVSEGAAPIAVSVGPIAHSPLFGAAPGHHAAVLLKEITLALPDGFEDHARRLFDFTPAEARLAAALAGGLALKEAALHQGIRFSTARSYLEGIFRKTRTNQQSQLVALLKSSQPLIRRS
ncbi:LuxR family transcriptional regulator [soil metagenome]